MSYGQNDMFWQNLTLCHFSELHFLSFIAIKTSWAATIHYIL